MDGQTVNDLRDLITISHQAFNKLRTGDGRAAEAIPVYLFDNGFKRKVQLKYTTEGIIIEPEEYYPNE